MKALNDSICLILIPIIGNTERNKLKTNIRKIINTTKLEFKCLIILKFRIKNKEKFNKIYIATLKIINKYKPIIIIQCGSILLKQHIKNIFIINTYNLEYCVQYNQYKTEFLKSLLIIKNYIRSNIVV